MSRRRSDMQLPEPGAGFDRSRSNWELPVPRRAHGLYPDERPRCRRKLVGQPFEYDRLAESLPVDEQDRAEQPIGSIEPWQGAAGWSSQGRTVRVQAGRPNTARRRAEWTLAACMREAIE